MKNAKAIVTAVGTVVTALSAALADDVLNQSEIGGLVVAAMAAAATIYAVWRVPNRPADSPSGTRAK
jgi:hypothetical protein